jgi:hypothetical protein
MRSGRVSTESLRREGFIGFIRRAAARGIHRIHNKGCGGRDASAQLLDNRSGGDMAVFCVGR